MTGESHFAATWGLFLARALSIPAALFCIALWGGALLRRVWPVGLDGPGSRLWQLSVGLSLYGTALVLFGFAGLYRPWLFALLLAVGPALHILERAGGRGGSGGSILIPRRFPCRPDLPSLGVIVAVILALLPAVAAPEIFYDALFYHLGLPSQYLLTGTVAPVQDVVHSSFPATLDLLFGAAMALGGVGAAKLFGLALLLLALAAVMELSRVLGSDPGNGAPWYGAALVATAPGVAIMATLTSVDVGMMFAGAMAWIAVAESRRQADGDGWRPLLAGAFPLALVAGSKYTGLYLVAALVPALLLPEGGRATSRSDGRDISAAAAGGSPRSRLRAAALMGGAALLLASPWYVRNALLHGNPFYPALGSLFGESPGGAWALGRLASDIPRYGWKEIGVILSSLFREGGRLGAGSDLGVMLPLSFSALAWCAAERRGPWLSFALSALLFLLLWGSNHQAARYIYPLLPLAAAAGGEALGAFSSLGPPARVAAVLLLLAGSAVNLQRIAAVEGMLYSPGGEFAQFLSGSLSSDDYLVSVLPHAEMALWVDGNLPKDAVILFVGETRPLYFGRKVLFASAYDRPRLAGWIGESRSGVELLARIRAAGATHVLVNRRELGRLRKSYGHLELTGGESGIVKDFLALCRPVKSIGASRLAELPASP